MKARTWNGEKMIYLSLRQTQEYPTDFVFRDIDEDNNSWIDDHVGEVEWPFMLWSGLKDVSGKDIYLDDICSCIGWYFGDSWESPFSGKVIFEDGQFAVIRENDSDYSTYQDLDSCAIYNRAIKVIGNIYENPELLTNQ